MQRLLRVGIMSAPTIRFSLTGDYIFQGKHYSGEHCATLQDGKVMFDGCLHDQLHFAGGTSFTLHEVVIGVNFHWQRREDQSFVGDLEIIVGHDNVLYPRTALIAINQLDVEDYLASVISSEMSATSSFELLKAHAIISRSWLLHPILNPHLHTNTNLQQQESTDEPNVRHIKWYERDAHLLFDVCADDHCQRYQGITRQTSENVQRAIDATRGVVLVSDDNGEVCDARFYKCCGGKTEQFETCWADEHYPYLETVEDPFCNTTDRRILQQVLNNYDQETHDFYAWQVVYTQSELSKLVQQRSGFDFGKINDLIPIKRGPSGRIYELQIVGDKITMTVGKELEIRRWLSKSHLYSSWFDVEKYTAETTNGKKETMFRLNGRGWGHGVGLCQIGAAVMADKGYNYKQILAHYFPNTTLKVDVSKVEN